MSLESPIHALWIEGLSSKMLAELIRQYPNDLHPLFNRSLMTPLADYLSGLHELMRQVNILNSRYHPSLPPMNLSLYTGSQRERYKPFVQYYMRIYKIPALERLVGRASYIGVHNGAPCEINALYDDQHNACLMIYTEALQTSLIPKYAH